MDSRATEHLRRHSQLEMERSAYESTWRAIGQYIRPLRQQIGDSGTPGGRRARGVYDSTPIMELDNLAKGITGNTANPANEWFEMVVPGDPDVGTWGPAREWLDQCTRLLRSSFAPSVSAFYQQIAIAFADMAAFGTAGFWSQEAAALGRFYDAAIPIAQLYIGAGADGQIDIKHRKWRPTGYEIKAHFGDRTPKAVVDECDRGNPMTRFDMLHVMVPNEEYEPGGVGPRGMKITSEYVLVDEGEIIEDRGFHESPLPVARWSVAGDEVWGRGQGELALADVKSLNAMQKLNLTMGERAANPTMLARSRDEFRGGVKMHPGHVMYDGLDKAGVPRIQPLYEGGNRPFALEMQESLIQRVKDAFLYANMLMVGDKQMTAYEVALRDEKQLAVLAPHYNAIETELLAPVVERRLGLLTRAGWLPPPPPELMAAGGVTARYQTPAERLQRVRRVNDANQVVQGLLAAAQIDPAVLDNFDGDEYAKLVGEAYGRGQLIRDPEEVARRREQRAQAEQAQAAIDSAPALAQASKAVAETQQITDQRGAV